MMQTLFALIHQNMVVSVSMYMENIKILVKKYPWMLKSNKVSFFIVQIQDATKVNGGIYLSIDNSKLATDDFRVKWVSRSNAAAEARIRDEHRGPATPRFKPK